MKDLRTMVRNGLRDLFHLAAMAIDEEEMLDDILHGLDVEAHLHDALHSHLENLVRDELDDYTDEYIENNY